jgi:putative phosphonate metabolism protein
MRYAIYFAPERGSLLDVLGTRWIGRNAWTGEPEAQPSLEGIAADRLAAVTAEARRYGWHATLKPPFALATGQTEARLRTAVADFAAERTGRVARLEVARVGDFVALVPAEETVDIGRFAAECVMAFDPYRAPPEAEEIARRRLAGLTPRQDELLLRWGYPYLFEEFRFHMTLTARVYGAEADRLEAAARAWFADALEEPVRIDNVAVFVEPSPGAPFTIQTAARLLDA